MSYFDELMPADHPSRMAGRGKGKAARLSELGTVCYPGLIHDFESGEAAGRELADFDPDVVVVAPSMAAPADFQWAAVRDLSRVPVVLLNFHELQSIPASFGAEDIIPNSVNVGSMMIGNILRREGRKFSVVTGIDHDAATWQRALETIRAAMTASALARSRLGIFGKALPGYSNVVCDPEALRTSVGCNLVAIPLAEFTDAFLSQSDGRVDGLAGDLAMRYRVEPAVDDPEYLTSVRMCLAVETICDRHGLDGGTLNCRDEFGIRNPAIGILGCLANSYMTTGGRPFTCTGDVLTAVAMFLGKRLAGDTYYCELDTIDYGRDAVLCANTGEGDFCQASGSDICTIRRSGTQSGRRLPGCNVFYRMPNAAGTAIAFTPRAGARGGHAIIAAEGQIESTPANALKLPSMLFRFANGHAHEAISRWIAAGPNHHAGISTGHHGGSLGLVASFLDIEFQAV